MATHGLDLRVTLESLLWALERTSQVHHVPFTAAALARELPRPYTLWSLRRGAELLGMHAVLIESRLARVNPATLPCLALIEPPARRNPSAQAADAAPQDLDRSAAPELRLVLVTGIRDGRVEFQSAAVPGPEWLPLKAFEAQRVGPLVRIEPQPEEIPASAAGEPGPGAFGLGWFLAEALRHKAVWRDVLLASAAVQLLALGVPLLTQVVIDKVILHRTTNTLIIVATALAAIALFSATLSWVRQYLVLHTGNRIDAVLALRVFEHLLRLPPRYFERRSSGTLVARLQGVETIREFIAGAALTLLLDLPFMLVFAAIMFYYSVPLTLIAMAILALIAAISVGVTPLLRKRINQQFLLGARNQAFLTEHLSAMETVKSLQLEPQLRDRFSAYLTDYLLAGFRARQLSNSFNVVANGLEQLLAAIILCAGAWLVMTTASMTIGMLVAFQMFAGRLSGPMLRLAGLWQEFQQVEIAVRRLADIMDVPPEPVTVIARRAASARGALECRALGFRYADDRPWLFRGLDLAIAPGQCVALMGPSGSGKSTLARLLQGFYLPSEGEILLDGVDVRQLAANELRGAMGVVPQETRLFSGSILDNLRCGNALASFEHTVQACVLAGIHDTIEQLPEGYQTKVGEHGVGLSGGQKQRIAIARALLRRPAVLVLDEPTSQLDPESAAVFSRAINLLRGKVSILLVAHQLPADLHCDAVVRMSAAAPNGSILSMEGGHASR